jgi:hypothetical protein
MAVRLLDGRHSIGDFPSQSPGIVPNKTPEKGLSYSVPSLNQTPEIVYGSIIIPISK